MFSLPKGTSIRAFERAKRDAAKQMVAHFAKVGWRLESDVLCRKMPMHEPVWKAIETVQGKTALVDVGVGLWDGHPWLKPGYDQYEVLARFSRIPDGKPIIMDIPDDVFNRIKDKVPQLTLAD